MNFKKSEPHVELSVQYTVENLLKEMMELLYGTRGPAEAFLGMSQVAHDVTVLPSAAAGSGASKVRWRRGPVVHSAKPTSA